MTLRKVFLPLSLLLASSLLAACGTGLPDASGSLSLADVAQLYANNNNNPQSWPEDRFQMLGQPEDMQGLHPGGKMGFKGPGHPGAKMAQSGFAPEASAEQQAFKAALAAAFVSDSFDLEALSAQLPSPPADLTPDNSQLRAKALSLIARAQAGELPAAPPEKPALPEGKPPHLSPLQSALNLSESQINQLQGLQHEPGSHQTAHTERHAALLLELNKAEPSVESVVALLQPPSATERPSPLQALAKLHSILTPEQRQLAVEQNLLPLQGPGHGMQGIHGGRMGHQGPGRPGPGFGGFGQPGSYGPY